MQLRQTAVLQNKWTLFHHHLKTSQRTYWSFVGATEMTDLMVIEVFSGSARVAVSLVLWVLSHRLMFQK